MFKKLASIVAAGFQSAQHCLAPHLVACGLRPIRNRPRRLARAPSAGAWHTRRTPFFFARPMTEGMDRESPAEGGEVPFPL